MPTASNRHLRSPHPFRALGNHVPKGSLVLRMYVYVAVAKKVCFVPGIIHNTYEYAALQQAAVQLNIPAESTVVPVHVTYYTTDTLEEARSRGAHTSLNLDPTRTRHETRTRYSRVV